jgi:hypothetical protein
MYVVFPFVKSSDKILNINFNYRINKNRGSIVARELAAAD